MQFFTSPADLKGWVKVQPSADEAATKIVEIIGLENQQDIVDTCRSIYTEDEDSADNASKVLFGTLAKHNLTQMKEGRNMTDKLTKQAQIMRQPGQYDMPLRVCPKLPFSVGGRLISTYNCRHYCIDSLVLDDDPERVYCAEALWRQHVMDKFSSDFKDKDGHLVGGYLNTRFQTFHDDGGNPMELANGEKTRLPRPHQYSTERRLEEARKEDPKDIVASNKKVIKLASVDKGLSESKIYKMFSDMVDMREAKINDEDIIYKVAEHYEVSIPAVASVYKLAMKQLTRHAGDLYKVVKTAFDMSPIDQPLYLRSPVQNGTQTYNAGTAVTPYVDPNTGIKNPKMFVALNGDQKSEPFEVDPNIIGTQEDVAVQEDADALGLTENIQGQGEFPIQDVTSPKQPMAQQPVK